MSFIPEAALSAPILRLLDRLSSSDLLNWARSQEQLHHNLQQWGNMFETIHAVLSDAENKHQHQKDSAEGRWLNRLRDLTYDVEDILDEFPPTGSSTTIDSDKVKEITFRLQTSKEQISYLGLKRYSGGEGSSYKTREGRETSSLEDDESLVRGRDLDKAALLQLLQLSPESSGVHSPLRPGNSGGMGGYRSVATLPFKAPRVAPAGKKLLVVPIIGMGGIGKTTLARLVYNDDRVKGYFDLRVWVCVSECFNVKELTKIILQKLEEPCDHLKDLDSLQQKLKEKLDGKKFLMVLDDVWSENQEEWDSLCRPLKAAASLGGRIIVTTRHRGVASSTSMASSTIDSLTLKGLSEADCISLLTQHAFGANDFKSHPKLQLIGEQIARKCKGSPLAAKTLGGLLKDKLKPDEWEDVLNSNIWDLSEEKSGILPALRLSYLHLPSSLKQCFAYFSIFPKDYEFEMEELILLWMAEGFLEQKNGRRKMEDLGRQYFRDLVSRSLLQQSSSDMSRYVMHDLIHDLAQFVAGEFCFRLEDGLHGINTCKISDKVRHCSYVRGEWEVIKKFDPFMGKKCQRTLLALPISSPHCYNRIAEKLISILLPQFRWLRVLGLSGYYISELPDSIGDLKQLRYLNLSSTAIICLPESVSGLHSLQSLVLDNCKQLSGLPRGVKSLTNLRHLSMNNTKNLKEMPMGLGSLKGLQKLSKFIVGKDNGLGIQELEHLSDLHGGLLISGLENTVDDQQAMRAKLKEKQHLQELELEWSRYIDDTGTAKDHVIESLQPHANIEALSISQYAGSKFPRWMVDPSFSKIVSIKLHNCKRCEFLPSLGKLLLLKKLWIGGLNEVTRVGSEFYGDGSSSDKPFPSLETLCFKDIENWEKWEKWDGVDVDAFSCLRELSIINCPKLVKVSPLSLPSLCGLKLIACTEVVLRSLRGLTSVTSLTIDNISGLVCLGDEFNQQLESLETLDILDCRELRCLWKKTEDHHPKGLPHLRRIMIRDCPVLEYFGAEEKEEGHLAPCNSQLVQLSALAELDISSCKNFVSFAGMRCPSLSHLDVSDRDAWECLPEGIMSSRESESGSNICPLQRLEIQRCPSFIRFPEGAVPKTLKRLQIGSCDKLEALPDGIMNTCGLEELLLFNCRSLKHFPPGELPISLRTLTIDNCLDGKMMPHDICLVELTIEDIYLKTLPECILVNLTELKIFDCKGLESFWEGGFLAPNLKYLSLYECNNIRCITDKIQSLTSLQHLYIYHCIGLERFPEVAFPSTLLTLHITDCKNVRQQISEWGLHKLTSLTHFTIEKACPDIVCFGEDFTLPSSLSSLEIIDFPNLDSLSPRLSQSLTSLQSLELRGCPKLQSFPKGLLELSQFNRLDITNCPNLKRLCEKEKGEYWSSISLLPEVIWKCDTEISVDESEVEEEISVDESEVEEDWDSDDDEKTEKNIYLESE